MNVILLPSNLGLTPEIQDIVVWKNIIHFIVFLSLQQFPVLLV